LREAVPAVLGRVEAIERTHGLLVNRIELEDPLVVGDRPRAVPGDLFGDESHFGEELRSPHGIRVRLDDTLVEAAQLVPLFARGQDLFETLEGALVARLQRE